MSGAEGAALPRQKRRHGGSHSASRDVQAVYRKLTEVVENFALLLETQPLTDTTVLQVQRSLPSLSAALLLPRPPCRYLLSELSHSLWRMSVLYS